ncbi:hypothetical protein GINT2_001261 [Glugoides intestinalis]
MNELLVKVDSKSFQYGLILSLLTRKPATFIFETESLCSKSIPVFLKLLSPQSQYKIYRSQIEFQPSALEASKHQINVDSIPETLEPIIILSPFLNANMSLEMTGITNHSEKSVDVFKITYYMLFKAFRLPKFDISIKKRGFGPLGEGKVSFKSTAIRTINSIVLKEPEVILKIRGLVITARIGSDSANRMVNKIKTEMSDIINTKILCIINNRNDSGPSPGYECSVISESKNGFFYETVNNMELPEKMAEQSCIGMLNNLRNGCVFDLKMLPTVLLFMGLAEGISHLAVFEIDLESQKILDLLVTFFNIKYTITKKELFKIITVVGSGYQNPFKPL